MYIYILKVLVDSARQIKLELNIYLSNYIKTIIQTIIKIKPKQQTRVFYNIFPNSL